jgi:hypothetical protein
MAMVELSLVNRSRPSGSEQVSTTETEKGTGRKETKKPILQVRRTREMKPKCDDVVCSNNSLFRWF